MSILPEKLPDSIDHAVENLTKPFTANVGTTFGDLWFLVFGGISQAAEKRRIKYANELNNFKRETEDRILEISPDDLKEPNTQIATQALEQSKYCVEEETLRQMFSELIASSMMKSRESIVHPSFASLLTQLSPDDALALLQFKDEYLHPILSINTCLPNSIGYFKLLTDVWEVCNDYNAYVQSQARLSSLERLGLVEVLYTEWLANDAKYEPLFNDSLRELANKRNEKMGRSEYELKIEKGCVRLTRLGINFISCVLPR